MLEMAAGREGDHGSSDIEFAKNVSVTFYTPEEYFVEDEGKKDEL